MPCGKLNTLAGFLSPTPSHLPQYTEKPAWQPGPTHSLRSYHTQQPGWSQYDRGRKRVVRAGPPQSETWHGCSFNMSVLPHSPLLPSHKPNARFKTCLQSAPCHPPSTAPATFVQLFPSSPPTPLSGSCSTSPCFCCKLYIIFLFIYFSCEIEQ